VSHKKGHRHSTNIQEGDMTKKVRNYSVVMFVEANKPLGNIVMDGEICSYIFNRDIFDPCVDYF
jgi:hypothetical protein